jgi:hypothetical protein
MGGWGPGCADVCGIQNELHVLRPCGLPLWWRASDDALVDERAPSVRPWGGRRGGLFRVERLPAEEDAALAVCCDSWCLKQKCGCDVNTGHA